MKFTSEIVKKAWEIFKLNPFKGWRESMKQSVRYFQALIKKVANLLIDYINSDGEEESMVVSHRVESLEEHGLEVKNPTKGSFYFVSLQLLEKTKDKFLSVIEVKGYQISL